MANHRATVLLDVLSCRSQKKEAGRWFIVKDMNCDGVFTISDVGLWLKWIYFLPGDGFLWALMQSPRIATFLELTPAVYSGWFSGVVSVIGWLVALVILGAISDWIERH